MSIISKETWEKIPEAEQYSIKKRFEDLYEEKQECQDKEDVIFYNGGRTVMKELFGEEALQSTPLTYRDVERELFKDKKAWYINDNSAIQSTLHLGNSYRYKTNLMTSRRQAEKLLAINKLLNVAKFLNKNEDGTPWKLDEVDRKLWAIGIEKYNKTIMPVEVGAYDYRTEIVYFRTQQLAHQAIQILGEDAARLALTIDF